MSVCNPYINEKHEAFWETNSSGERVLRIKGEVWFSFEAEYPQPKGDLPNATMEWSSKKKRKKQWEPSNLDT